jgi:ElaB/YqjD/DUF883 family membrane-anchored ribosome-binding protein
MPERDYETPGQRTWDEGAGTPPHLRDQAAAKIAEAKDKAHDVNERVADAGRKATDKVDAQRGPAASTLENAAERLRERGDKGNSATARAARTSADKLQATAEYIRENDVRAMADDVEDVVRRHPVPALAAAAVAGFLIGKALSNHD